MNAHSARSAANGSSDIKPPSLAIIITCFNYERFVSQAIRSVTSQLRDDCQLIVIDDGSTDASWEAIRAEGVEAYRVENGGARAACLHGIATTRAPFLLFLDADDELAPGALDTIVSHLDSGVAKLQFPLVRIDEHGAPITGHPVPKLESFRDRRLTESVLRTGVYTSPPTSGNVFRRDVCELLAEVDYEPWIDGVMLFAAPFYGDVVSLSEPLGRYRIHGCNDSGLGRAVDPQVLRRELKRFVDRMRHLRQILQRFEVAQDLVRTEEAYFYLERSFYLAVAEGRDVSISTTFRLLKKLWGGENQLRTKCTLGGFLMLTALLPNRRAQRSLSYRLDVGIVR
ncbi:glycosyltransferase family 2 protein [Rhizobium grahamii]|uniref:glycosyltransferase family 2 protein n=1 Tax=Rhizobium grahamii TaxID=1120045 RepID=UPI001FF01E3B|nr:glycosyltransferase family 2 protein [Rhizobium grahamii]